MNHWGKRHMTAVPVAPSASQTPPQSHQPKPTYIRTGMQPQSHITQPYMCTSYGQEAPHLYMHTCMGTPKDHAFTSTHLRTTPLTLLRTTPPTTTLLRTTPLTLLKPRPYIHTPEDHTPYNHTPEDYAPTSTLPRTTYRT